MKAIQAWEPAMNALLYRENTVVPSEADSKVAADASRVLAKSKQEGELRVRLDNGPEVILPKGVDRLLRHLLTEMSNGNAVTIIPVHAEFTTQEAADYLNVSRPHLISLLEAGKLEYHKVGAHRRIKFSDVSEYKARQEADSKRAQRELAGLSQELELY